MATLFLVAVLLPCLYLAYLGIRSTKQEERWQQELVLQNLRTLLSTAIEKTEESVLRDLRSVFDTLYAQAFLPATINTTALHAFPLTSSFVDQVFVFDRYARLLFPRTFRGPSRRDKASIYIRSAVMPEELTRGEQQEARGDYQHAADLFSQGLRTSSSTSERLKLFVRLARCQMKSGDLSGARSTYVQAIAEDRDRFFGEELPYTLVAYEQLAFIEEKLLRPDSARVVLLRLYASMLQRFDAFEQAQFEYHLTRVRMELERLGKRVGGGSRSQIASLGQAAELVHSEAARANLLRSALVPVADSLLTASPGFHYRRTMINGTPEVVGFWVNTEVRKEPRIVGVILRRAALTSLCAALLKNTPIGTDLRLVLMSGGILPASTDPAGATTLVMEEPFIRLASLMPRDRIAIVAINSDPVAKIASRTMMLYYALTATMIAIIILGAFLLFRDVSREQELSRMKTEFISNITHEIKTPIAAIRSLAGNVTEGWVTDGKKQKEYFRMIERESVRLGHLVENTLDFSRIESGRKRYRMEVMPAKQFLERIVEHFLAFTDGQDLTLTSSLNADLPKIKVDGQAIAQAILNLLDNAAKYSPGEKLLELGAKKEGDYLVITVKDHGIGIPKTELANIFDKFYRVELTAGANVPGSGIGLTLVKEIVEAHGGRVAVESEPDHGSAFSIYVPIVREEQHAADTDR